MQWLDSGFPVQVNEYYPILPVKCGTRVKMLFGFIDRKSFFFTGKVIFPLSVCDTSLYFLKTHHKNESHYLEDSAYLLQ